MQIPADENDILNEADVETKVLTPLLIGPQYLGYARHSVQAKNYLAPTLLDKTSGKSNGYFPDYSVWLSGFIILIVEAKAPSVQVEVGYREASLYARHINQQQPTGLNPCHFIIACNGKRLLAGYDDASPELDIQVSALQPGTKDFNSLIEFCGLDVISRHAAICLSKARVGKAYQPYRLAGGPAILNTLKPFNSFAPDLAPVLRRYFSTNDPYETPEVVEKAYVSTPEITEYDRVLESLLKDRIATRSPAIVRELVPTRKHEPHMSGAIATFAAEKSAAGQLQIVQGAVGTGKSIFIRRYKDFLQPAEQRAKNRWAFIDFLAGPSALKGPEAQSWVCKKFYESFQK